MRWIGVVLVVLMLCVPVYASTSSQLNRNLLHGNVYQKGFGSVTSGQTTTPAATVGTVLTTTSTPCDMVYLSAGPGNLQNLYIGGSTAVSEDNGFVLSGDAVISVAVDNVTDIYISSDIAGQKVSWLALTE